MNVEHVRLMAKPGKPALLLACLALAACAAVKKPADPVPGNPQVLLLGEVHDNPEGHRERFADLRRRVEAGWRPALVMEQFDHENQGLLTRAQKGCHDPECVIRVMASPGWDWSLYRPVLDLALTYELPLIAGNLSRADASRVVRDGVASSFDAPTVQAYRLAAPVAADIRSGQQEEIVAGHCNMLPDMMIGGMVDAQIARDIWMAKIIRAQMPRDVVLLAGNGHVRNDIGVARWINFLAPALTLRSEGYVEQAVPAGTYDVVHRIAPHPRTDPCAGLKGKPAASKSHGGSGN